jgi:hypothetical protein
MEEKDSLIGMGMASNQIIPNGIWPVRTFFE